MPRAWPDWRDRRWRGFPTRPPQKRDDGFSLSGRPRQNICLMRLGQRPPDTVSPRHTSIQCALEVGDVHEAAETYRPYGGHGGGALAVGGADAATVEGLPDRLSRFASRRARHFGEGLFATIA